MSSIALATWAADSPRQHDPAASAAAMAGIRDVLGCILAGSREEEPQQVARAVRGWGSGDCRLLGTDRRAPAPWAALVNGTAAHVLDFDDTFDPLSGHAAAVLVPAILATAQESGASGADVIDAFIIGLEVLARIGEVVNPRHYALGWHATSTIGVIGAAAACGRLLRLDAAQMAAAMSLGVSQAGGSRMQLGAPAKSLHAGLAAKGGVLAAGLAATGMSGVADSLGGRWRFAELFTGETAPEDAFIAPAPGDPPAVLLPGLNFKPYPTCAATHLTLDMVLALRDAHGLIGEDIAQVDTHLPAVLARNLMHPNPQTGMQARFSMPYPVAVALMEGAVRTADFEPEAIFRSDIRRLMPRVQMHEIPNSLGAPVAPPTEVTITLHDGRRFTDARSVKHGSQKLPMSEAEQQQKFRDCAGRVLPPDSVARALAELDRLATAPQLLPLLTALSPLTQPDA